MFIYMLIFTVHLSCTPVPVMHATWLYYSTRRVASDNPEFLCLDPGVWSWWPYCSWSECAVNPSVTIGVQQKLGLSPQLFLSVPLLFGSRDPSCCSWVPLSFCISLHMMCFCIFWWCNIPVILSLSVITLYLYFSVAMYITTVLSSLILTCTDA